MTDDSKPSKTDAAQAEAQAVEAASTVQAESETPPAAAAADRETPHEAAATEPADQPHAEAAASPPQSVIHSRDSSRSGLIALLLALVAVFGLIGLGAAGYLQLQGLENRNFAQDQNIGALQQSAAALQVDNKSRNQWFDAASERSRKLDRQIETLQQQQAADQAHQQRVDQALGQLAEQVQGGQMAWRKAEIEHLLLVANARAQLEKDLAGARIALKLAAERLASLADPAFFPVQQVVGRELARLDAVEAPDLQGLALKLSALTDQLETLPMQQAPRGQFDTELKLSSGPQEAPWHQRLWVSVREAVGSLVSIRRDVERREPLLPPQQDFFLRQNLRLQLESARLALLREDSASYQAALRQADDWLQRYFDPAHPATKAAARSIQQLATQDITVQLPDISGSLKALRAVGAGT